MFVSFILYIDTLQLNYKIDIFNFGAQTLTVVQLLLDKNHYTF